MRCQSGFNVAQIAEQLNGGGHAVAAGFKITGQENAKKAIEAVMDVVNQYYQF
jgi:nanoRNase/pAp phosphatase (c-di-AMP/oligoRNAs hydrolase)